MTNKIYGNNGTGPISGLGGVRKPQSAKAQEQEKVGDRVDFSSVLQQVNRARETAGTTETQRMDKVQELKAQIAQGSYKPDLDKVAESLMKYIVEEG